MKLASEVGLKGVFTLFLNRIEAAAMERQDLSRFMPPPSDGADKFDFRCIVSLSFGSTSSITDAAAMSWNAKAKIRGWYIAKYICRTGQVSAIESSHSPAKPRPNRVLCQSP